MNLRFILTFVTVASASVIGIDYGTDWFKVSIVKPGVPLDIVLNRESKRKTSSIVTLRDHIRLLGSESTALATKFPAVSYPALKAILGERFDGPAAQAYAAAYLNGIHADSARDTCAFDVDGAVFPVEELVAMQLSHARGQAETYGNEPVLGAVITVPPFFSQFERQALLDGAELAGLKVLALIDDETAGTPLPDV